MAVKAKAPKPVIKAATIATAIDKATGKVLGWAVKSNHTEEYYQIRFEVIAGERVFFCDCEAHLWGCSECCHIKSVLEVLLAKAEMENQEVAEAIAEAEELVKAVVTEQGGTPVQVAQTAMTEAAEQQIAQIAQKKPTPQIAAPTFKNKHLPLNGNQGFSLLKR